MKKYLFIALAGILALGACSQLEDNQNTPRQMSFTAGFGDGVQTRATLNGSTKDVSFDAGDKISIFSTLNANKPFTTTAGGASATFTGEAADDGKFYAVYPYTDGLILDGTTIKGVVIPSMQSDAASSSCGWDPSAPIAYATTTDASLAFHNACALLKITNNIAASAIIMITSSNTLTGTFDLNTSTGALSETDSHSLAIVDGVSSGKTIYIAIAPGKKENFKASVISSSGGKKKEPTTAPTFEAGKIYDLGSYNLGSL